MSGRLLIDPSTGLPVLLGGQLLVMPPRQATPTVAVLAASPAVDVLEGETAVIRVSVDPAMSAVPLTFNYATVPGTALAGTDFNAITSSATIPAGQSYVDLLIPTINRSGTNGSRAFTVTISNAQAGTYPINLSNATATITIADVASGVVLPTLGLETVTAQNEGTSLVFRVRASKTHTAAVSLAYTTQPGSALAGTDYTTQSGTKTIPIGQSFVDITVPTIARAGYQGARSLSVTISAATDGTNTIEIHTPTVNGLIRDTETPTATGSHDYFEALIAHPNYYTGYSMRPVSGQPQLYQTGHPHAGKRNPYYANQLLGTSNSERGYANDDITGGFTRMLYSPSTDTHPQAQDAMRTVIPNWERSYPLKTALTTGATTVHVQIDDWDSATSTWKPVYIEKQTHLLIDNEVMQVMSLGTPTGQPPDGSGGRTITVTRATNGTAAATHTAGTIARISSNSLWPQFRPPIGTANGFAYFIAWDFYFTDDYLSVPVSDYYVAPLDYYKCFQLGSTEGANWLEMQTRFGQGALGAPYQPPTYNPSTHVGVATWRAYGNMTNESNWVTACSGKTKDFGRYNYTQGIFDLNKDPLSGQLNAVPPLAARNGGFLLYPGRWVRCFMFYKQNVNDWDDMTIWMADEVVEPRQELHTMKMSIDGATNGSIKNFWVELNTSQQQFTRHWAAYGSPANLPPLTMYHRDLVVHRMPATTTVDDIVADPDLLVKPLP